MQLLSLNLWLSLASNALTGPFPAWMASCFPYLEGLNLSWNHFHGTLPEEWQTLQDLTYINLSGNSPLSLNATSTSPSPKLPEWIFQFPNLERLFLVSSGLQYSQDLPCSTGLSRLNRTLMVLDLSQNNLTGPHTPQCIAQHNFTQLYRLSHGENPLSVILSDIPLTPSITYLNQSSCSLSGDLSIRVGRYPYPRFLVSQCFKYLTSHTITSSGLI